MSQARRSIGQEFHGQGNSLNAIRLMLASLVIVSHAWPIGGFGHDPALGHTALGGAAVACFFAISGFLITRSREHTTGARYLWHRCLRIVPGYWVCLTVIAAIIAPLAWVKYHSTLSGYPTLGSLKYLGVNLSLWTKSVPSIGGTQITVPADLRSWNGAAWSIFYEFLCYLGVAALAWWKMLRARAVVTVLVLGSILLIALEVAPTTMNHLLFHSDFAFQLVTTGTIYCAGALLWLLRDKIPSSPFLAIAATFITLAGVLVLDQPDWLIAFPVAYLCIWLGIKLPFSKLFQKVDISYGVYIYGYPVAMLLFIYDVPRYGVFVYAGLTFLIVIPLALASWFGVEQRAMRLKGVGRRSDRAGVQVSQPVASEVGR